MSDPLKFPDDWKCIDFKTLEDAQKAKALLDGLQALLAEQAAEHQKIEEWRIKEIQRLTDGSLYPNAQKVLDARDERIRTSRDSAWKKGVLESLAGCSPMTFLEIETALTQRIARERLEARLEELHALFLRSDTDLHHFIGERITALTEEAGGSQ